MPQVSFLARKNSRRKTNEMFAALVKTPGIIAVCESKLRQSTENVTVFGTACIAQTQRAEKPQRASSGLGNLGEHETTVSLGIG
jgi:hypothetical protein